jgi:hypothetical protein
VGLELLVQNTDLLFVLLVDQGHLAFMLLLHSHNLTDQFLQAPVFQLYLLAQISHSQSLVLGQLGHLRRDGLAVLKEETTVILASLAHTLPPVADIVHALRQRTLLSDRVR